MQLPMGQEGAKTPREQGAVLRVAFSNLNLSSVQYTNYHPHTSKLRPISEYQSPYFKDQKDSCVMREEVALLVALRYNVSL